jgi:integrase
MPKLAATAQPYWVIQLRKHLRSLVIQENGRPEPGWFVGELPAGGVYLQKRTKPADGSKAVNQIVRLPYQWREEEAISISQRLSQIRKVMLDGDLDLPQAAARANGTSSTTSNDGWVDAVEKFHRWKLNHGKVRCSEANWQAKYQRYLDVVLVMMRKSNPPSDATELLERLCQSNPRWGLGTRSRQIAVGNTTAFLRFAVTRCGFAQRWLPPLNTSEIVGTAAKRKAEPVPLSDAQILRLLESLPTDETGNRWRFLLQVMATYGLRPEDARQVTVVDGQLYTRYQKASGGGYTEPRFLFPLNLRDLDGSEINWHLLERFQAGERFPSLGEKGQAADRIGTYLKRNATWKSIKAELAAAGKQLKPYGFRHGYVKRGQMRSIPPKVLATACGHSLETHLRVYSCWDARNELASYFDGVATSGGASVVAC